jgi:hypothetical protein
VPPRRPSEGSTEMPLGLERALATRLDRGKYIGLSLTAIRGADRGLKYIGMLTRHLPGPIGDAAAVVLEHEPGDWKGAT